MSKSSNPSPLQSDVKELQDLPDAGVDARSANVKGGRLVDKSSPLLAKAFTPDTSLTAQE